MIAIMSPARKIKVKKSPEIQPTPLLFSKETAYLLNQLKTYSPWELENLLKIKPEMALKTATDYQNYNPYGTGTPAILAYHGIAYQYMEPTSFTKEDFAFAKEHVRILSAFYGALRPSDGIQPYRLELQSRIKINNKNLYQFWGSKIYTEIQKKGEPLINLASGEYAKAVLPYLQPKDLYVNCQFLVKRKGKFRCLPTEAKMARGRMVHFIIKEKLTAIHQVQEFNQLGFRFSQYHSDPVNYIFLKEEI